MSEVEAPFPHSILLVEDDPGDQELVKRAIARAELSCQLHMVADGEAALAYLDQFVSQQLASAAPRPDLVLLDLNLPRVSGLEVLKHIRATEGLRRLPVIALTTSHADRDIDACYAAGVNAYVVKPSDPIGFSDFISSLARFWFHVAALPRA